MKGQQPKSLSTFQHRSIILIGNLAIFCISLKDADRFVSDGHPKLPSPPPLSEKPKRVSLVMTALVPIVTKSPTTYIADSDTRNIGPDRLKL